MASVAGAFAPMVPLTRSLSLQSHNEALDQQRYERDINGEGYTWDGLDQDGNGEAIGLRKIASRKSARQRAMHPVKEEGGMDAATLGAKGKADAWELTGEVREYQKYLEESGLPARKLGVEWSGLTVMGKGADAVMQDTVFSQLDLVTQIKAARKPVPEKTILDDSFGCAKPGEMLLVLARPGGGATTLLRLLSNQRSGYTHINGDVRWGTMDHKEAEKYRGQIVMNSEEEIFYPSMTVHQTISFATALKVPMNLPKPHETRKEYLMANEDFLLRSMGISHTIDTKVGDAYTRGVSGGERKRVSIIEVLATKGAVFCWDNSTRGLDASTALAWAQAIRVLTDVLGVTSIVTLYQAGNSIYELFDKTLVLDVGKQIYYGPAEHAQSFFESLGFEYTDGANIGDFLTGVVVPTERKIAKGRETSFPRTANDIREAYQASKIFQSMKAELGYHKSEEAKFNTEEFRRSVTADRHKSLPKESQLTVPFGTQIMVLTKRQYQMIWGAKSGMVIRQGACLVQALVAGSLFYNISNTSNGLFLFGGTLFFSVLYNSLVAMNEVQESFAGRAVLIKHKQFALFHPASFVLSQIFSDIPILFFQITVFSLVVYFMTGLKATAGAFFTYYAIVFSATMAMTAMFRAIGSAFGTFNNASKVSGLIVSITVTYAGYIIYKPNMHPWFKWLYILDPLQYALEALMANELHGRTFPCVGNNLIPSGRDYTTDFASCAGVPGSIGTTITGTNYLGVLDFHYSSIWRNFGILWVFWAGFVVITAYLTTFKISGAASNTFLKFVRGKAPSHVQDGKVDEEAAVRSIASSDSNTVREEQPRSKGAATLMKNTSVFTWRDLKYTVKVPGGERLLLDSINGFVKPGQLGALMGSSGAGKTTLLDVLAQRKTDGTIQGKIYVDGRPLPLSFQRSAGYCEQLDVHESLATVREALEFSAILRQPRGTSRKDKLAYVDTIIDLLELHDIADALIGTPGAGLGVEQRKRLTIGVELVAKPSILIFLDEPTSGLDSQSAFSIVRFLRKLADVGQAVLVTIHQPSASLFYQFDTLLLLARGGKTVYNGLIGENASTIKAYFEREGAPCPPGVNIAEHMIAVVTGHMSTETDWNKIWLESKENKAILEELDAIEADVLSRPVAYDDDGEEFATPASEQFSMVLKRNSVSLFRDTEYINNKIVLHIFSALFNGFTFWMIGDSAADLQQKLFSIFTFIFVAPGVIAQVQPLFIARRDIFEAREKKAKMYSWWAFCYGLVVSEIPYLCVCALLYFACWWFTAGFPSNGRRATPAFLEILLYEFLYTGIAQFISAYAPNANVAALVVPILVGSLVSFSGVLVPYAAITAFWRYWLYYLNPFTYLMGALLWFGIWDETVNCKIEELAVFDTPNGETCANYLNTYLTDYNTGANLLNPDATSGCQVCSYTTGTDYLYTLNLKSKVDGWRDIGITVIFVCSSYALVFALMKLRTKRSKTAE